MRILALDIGGTTVKYGLFDDKETKYGQFSVKDIDGNENMPQSICSFAKEHMPEFVAVSAPGPFDFETGTGLMTHKLLSMYNVSLKEELNKVLPFAKTLFIHDSTAFAVGIMSKNPILKDKKVAAVMLGTGLGYTFINKGKVLLNFEQTPLHPLWNRPFLKGKSEDYVSTKTLLSESERCGFKCENVRDIALEARKGNKKLLEIFYEYGKNLGLCVLNAQEVDPFSELVIGGQISRSWDLMKAGFEKQCKIKYSIVVDPVTCAIDGLYACAINGKEKFCEICEE